MPPPKTILKERSTKGASPAERPQRPEHDLHMELYRSLYMTRRAEELIRKHYHEDDMKTPMHMSAGQEAIPVGVCHALKEDDQVFSTYRSHATFLAKTKRHDSFFGELYGKITGTARGRAGSMHLADPEKNHICSSAIVGSCLPLAVGMAFANKYRKNGNIACVFFGDGALDEGVFWESLNLACVMKLPVLFVCEDNGFAVHTPKRVRQGFRSITDVVSQFNCRVFQDDTTDVERIYQLAKNATASIRSSGEPVFLHFRCYRYLEHVGINEDFDAGYRDRAEFEEWHGRDCLALQRRRLLRHGLSDDDVQKMEQDIDAELQGSLERAKEAPFSQPEELHLGVFHEHHATD